MSVDTRKEPYYDDYNPSKQYTQILAVPGRVEQAREFTQVQTMIFDFLKRLSDTLLKDGNIVSGMSYKQDGNNVTVLDGRVYIDGKIHEFKQQTVTIGSTGTDVVGVKLNESVVTYQSDNSLTDPATDMENFGMAGADRIKSVPILTVNDEEASELYVFENGELKIAVAVPELDGITDVLAKRTYDESGNYRVRGLELDVEPYDASNVQAVVNVGTAYIKGYDVTKPYPVKKVIPMAKATATVTNEPKTFSRSKQKYALNNYPASAITRVSASVQVTESKTRSSSSDIDYLNNGSVLKIDSVYAGSTIYTKGTHYQLTSDGVEWISTTRPANGTSYTVVYTYLKSLVKGTDYSFLQEQADAWGSTKDYLNILNTSAIVDNSVMYIDYTHYLARIDAITLDKDGNIVVVEGQPAKQRDVREPIVLNEDLLLLGYICLPPNSGNGKAINKVVTRTDMATIQKMGERLSDVEYNLALTQLDIEAITGESPAELQGVFTDGFYTTTKGDTTHKNFTAMYSLEDAMILIPYTNVSVQNGVIDSVSSNIGDSFGRVVTAPYEEVVAINQPFATTTMLINPYLAFNSLAVMKVIPEVDNWIDDETIEVEKSTYSTRTFNRWWGHTDIGYKLDDDLQDAIIEKDGTLLRDFRGWDTNIVVNATNYSTNIVEEAITYMRQKDVEIQVSNLVPNTDNLVCTFDGVRVNLKSTGVSGYGTINANGTARANGSGVLHAKFTIPHGIKTGTREISLSNANNSCSGSYTSIGTKRTTTNTVLHQRVTLNAVDPLAQTFSFSEDTIVTSVGLYFAGDASGTENVVVQIRNTQNGYPSNVIYEEVVVPASSLRISNKANLETKITFKDPVYCNAGEQYAICVETDSQRHSLYICELGGNDIVSGAKVNNQPYLAGMLFSSSNGLAWTAHQASNMKFKVYKAVFEEEGTIEFSAMTNVSLDTLLVLADYLTPQNTGCIWEFATSKNGRYIPLTAYSQLELDSVISSVYLRATFKSNTNISPIMAVDNFTFVGFLQDVKGTYISKNVSLSDYYTKVKVTYEAYEPIGSSVTASIAHDTDGNTWITNYASDDKTDLQDGWVYHEVIFNVDQSTQATQFRVRLDLNASNSMVLRPKARRLTVVLN